MKTKFTKGEWLLNEKENGYLITGEAGFGVCCTMLHDEIDEHNAHIIKTAPKLYAMLDKIATQPRCAVSVAPDIKLLLAEARGEL